MRRVVFTSVLMAGVAMLGIRLLAAEPTDNDRSIELDADASDARSVVPAGKPGWSERHVNGWLVALRTSPARALCRRHRPARHAQPPDAQTQTHAGAGSTPTPAPPPYAAHAPAIANAAPTTPPTRPTTDHASTATPPPTRRQHHRRRHHTPPTPPTTPPTTTPRQRLR